MGIINKTLLIGEIGGGNMSKTIADVRKEKVAEYKTAKQQYSDFPIGTVVKVIVPCEDSTFFYGETGVVIKNSGSYLGIIVKFDKKFDRPNFNFKPEDLLILGTRKFKRCPHCGEALL